VTNESKLDTTPIILKEVYERRFDAADVRSKEAIWRELCRYLQRFVPRSSRVVDVACDVGYFIRNIQAQERWATDIRNMASALPEDVRFVHASGLELDRVMPTDYFDVVFFSNYLEHLATTEAVVQQLRVAFALLRTGGKIVILQPNIKLIGGAYWDFIDHQTALTEHSLAEAAEMVGFKTSKVVTRFLPYTTKSRVPRHPMLVRAYLAIPPLWLVFGKQTLFVAVKP
jgi:SAM-dependent methyltransferase